MRPPRSPNKARMTRTNHNQIGKGTTPDKKGPDNRTAPDMSEKPKLNKEGTNKGAAPFKPERPKTRRGRNPKKNVKLSFQFISCLVVYLPQV